MQFDLVFEGGGAKGMAFVGACQEFFSRGHTFDRVLGTSAGAISAALLAAGYSPDELIAALSEKDAEGNPVFKAFMGPPPPFSKAEIKGGAIRKLLDGIDFKFLRDSWEDKLYDKLAETLAEGERTRNFVAFVERGGWYAADKFVEWLTARMDSGPWKDGQRAFSGMTLAQFHDETKIELSVVAADTTEGRLLVLNHNTAPDLSVVWAVRMSMSIPLVWDEVEWKAEWGKYLGNDMTGHRIVDGGLLSNFPLELFISDQPEVTKVMGPKRDTAVLGLLIDETKPVPVQRPRGFAVDVDINVKELRTVQRLNRLVNTATTAHDKMVLEEFEHLVVRLPAEGYGTTDFSMSETRREALVDAARAAMKDYLDNYAPPAARGGPRGMAAPRGSTSADRLAAKLLGGG